MRRTCPPRAGVNPTRRTPRRPCENLSPAGGGESAVADLGVEFFRLGFGLWLAGHSVPSQRGGNPDGQTQGSAPTFRNAAASGLPWYIQVTQPRRGCPYNPDGLTQGPAPTLEKLQEIVDELNNRPKKRLGYRTPHEMFLQKLTIALNARRT